VIFVDREVVFVFSYDDDGEFGLGELDVCCEGQCLIMGCMEGVVVDVVDDLVGVFDVGYEDDVV